MFHVEHNVKCRLDEDFLLRSIKKRNPTLVKAFGVTTHYLWVFDIGCADDRKRIKPWKDALRASAHPMPVVLSA